MKVWHDQFIQRTGNTGFTCGGEGGGTLTAPPTHSVGALFQTAPLPPTLSSPFGGKELPAMTFSTLHLN